MYRNLKIVDTVHTVTTCTFVCAFRVFCYVTANEVDGSSFVVIRARFRLQINDHDRHVIPSNPLRSPRIITDNVIEHFHTNLSWCHSVNSVSNVLDGLRICQTVPDPVASKNKKLVIRLHKYSIATKQEAT
jgi:hypothetical protein